MPMATVRHSHVTPVSAANHLLPGLQRLTLEAFHAASAATVAAVASAAAPLKAALDATPARFLRKAMSAAEMAAIESGGAF